MTTALACEQVQESLAVFVLGALDPAERESVEEHLRACPSCAAGLAELAPIPALLNRAAAAEVDVPAPRPPEAVLERALAQVHAERARSRRRTVGLLAAAAVVVLAVVVTFALRAVRAPQELVAHGASQGVSATVVLTAVPSGTSLALSLQGVTPGEHCRLVAVSGSDSEVASSWEATYDGAATVTGTTGFDLADISRLDIRTDDGRLLVSMPVQA